MPSALGTDFAQAGDVLSFEFDVANTGNTTLSNLAIADPLAGTVSCPTSTLAPGASTVCSASYAVTQADVDAGSVTNTATLDAQGPDGAPLPTLDDSVTVTGTRTPRLSLAKASPQTGFAAVGDALDYTFTVRKSGNVVITGLAVSDNRIATVSCPVTVLAPGEQTVCTGFDTVTQADIDAGVVTNVATATGMPSAGTALPSVTATLSIEAQQSRALSLTKVASQAAFDTVGDVIDYTYTLTNDGNVTLRDPLSVSYDRIASVSCPALPSGGLAPGGSLVCTASDVIT